MDRYTKLSRLGRGRFGDVYLAQDLDSALVALKQISLDSEAPPSEEVQVLSALSHPNIVQFLGSFQDDGYLIIALEYVEGGDLAQRISTIKAAESEFSEEQVWKWLKSIAQALEHMHSHRILHRDLKPSNLLLTKTGDVKVSDFGYSRILNASEELAMTGVGTPYYVAPEVCLGEGYASEADIWSFGCILYELCALRRPFEGENLAGIVSRILHSDPLGLPGRFSDKLTGLILSMLDKDKHLRPSIRELLNVKKQKSYQNDISIRIPTPKNAPVHKQPSSAPANHRKLRTPSDPSNSATRPNANLTPLEHPPTGRDCATAKTRRKFTFSESLLKECPHSPFRPMLMVDFIRKKLGEAVFERVKRALLSAPDLMLEEPERLSALCGPENLGLIDVGLAFDVFSLKSNAPYPPTSTHRAGASRLHTNFNI